MRRIYGLYTPDRMYGPKPFRLDAQKIGNVVIFMRWENSADRAPVKPRGFCWSQSHSIATIKQQLEGVSSSHGIVRYQFAGIEMMVRFELDAVTEAAPKMRNVYGEGEEIERMDRCLDSMRRTPVGEEKGLMSLPPSNEYKGGIKIHRTPYTTPPLSSYLEKKTRSSKGELDYVDIYGQLIFSQTPHLYVARHTRGNFTSLEKVSLGKGKLRDIEISTTGIMGKVAGMIKEMMECVDEFGECSFIWKGEGSNIEVWRGEKQIGLGEEAREMLLAA
jgi:hypothetical protein